MIKNKIDLIEALTRLKMEHHVSEDCWYTCPKSEECCNDVRQGRECDCGADDHNKILYEIMEYVAKL